MADRLYIVAECGGTHNGSFDTARALIWAAKDAGADAVKFTMRDLDAEMSPQMAAMPYPGPHSYGATYGEHRAALELSQEHLAQLRKESRQQGLDFGLTVCAPRCVEQALLLDPAWLKVASRDAGNWPLIAAIRERWTWGRIRKDGDGKLFPNPVVVSDGLNRDAAMTALLTLRHGRADDETKLLHTISQYPADVSYLNARDLHESNGYSDHVPGWHMCIAAVALGGRWIEKHLTLDNKAKGTDHEHALEPADFARMVRECREVVTAGSLGWERGSVCWPTFVKLGRSLAVSANLEAGYELTRDDIHMVSPGTGLPWAAVSLVTGRKLLVAKRKNELLTLEDVE